MLTAKAPTPPATEMPMVAATGNAVLPLLEPLLCSSVVVVFVEPLLETPPLELLPAVAVTVAMGAGSSPWDPWIADVLGATSRVPVAEVSGEIVCVPLRVSEAELEEDDDDDELVFAGCVDDGDVCAEVDVVLAARSVLCQLI